MGPGTYIYLNPLGGVFQPRHTFGLLDPTTKAGFTLTLEGAEAGAFIMTHDERHKHGKFGKTDNDDPRTESGKRNGLINNFKVWQACFPAIKPQPYTGSGLPPP